ncbi:MAG: hypothetical protein H6618_08045 [Deltaproteobacteria bacterium]|nr:hypothetical protein [Deltaproteobacteria bacterium]
MNDSLILAGSLATAATSCLLYLMERNKKQQQQKLTEELSEKLKLADESSRRITQENEEIRKDSGEKNKKQRQLEKDLLKSKERAEKLRSEHEQALTDLRKEQSKAHDKMAHLRTQMEALTSQMQEADEEKKQLRLKADEARDQVRQVETQAQQHLKDRLKVSEHKIRNLEDELRKKDKLLSREKAKPAADPAILRKSRAKLSQYAHLYRMMRSQKEMSDERIRNWELALSLLSSWVLKQQGHTIHEEQNLGIKVASALEAARLGPLVQDEFSASSEESLNQTESRAKDFPAARKKTSELRSVESKD